ncbi:hypothetical protein OAM07_03255 [Crocinitomicaceae bacterium]|nr:hypothetical protein [Crocinitomicaceae bacterium]
MEAFIIFSINLFCIFLFSSIIFLIGKLIVKRILGVPEFVNNFYHLSAYYTLIGSLCVILIFSVIITSGKTINWGILIAFILLFYQKPKQKSKINRSQNLWSYLSLIISVLLVFLLNYVFLNFPSDLHSIKGDNDFYFYSKISQGLVLNHSENALTAIGNSNSVSFPMLYHYGDLYLNAFSKLLFNNLNYSTSLALLIYPFLISITLLIIVAEIKKFEINFRRNYLTFILGILIILGFCYLFDSYNSAFYNLVKVHFDRFLFGSKNLLLFPIVIFIFLSINYKTYQIVIPFSIFGICIYSTTIPALISLSLFVLYISFKNYNFKSKNSFLIFLKSERKIILSFLLMCLFIFYIMTLTKAFENVQIDSASRNWSTKLIMLIEYTIAPLISSPILLIILTMTIVNNFKKQKHFFELLTPIFSALFVFFCCAIFIVNNHEVPEIKQSISNISGPILISLIVVYIIRLKTLQLYSIIFLLLIVSGFNVSKRFYRFSEIKKEELTKNDFDDLKRNVSRNFLNSTKWAVIGPKFSTKPTYSFNNFYYPFMEFDNVNVPIDISYYFYSDAKFKFGNSPFFKRSEIQSLKSLNNRKKLIESCRRLNIEFILFIEKDFFIDFKIKNLKILYAKGGYYLYRIS